MQKRAKGDEMSFGQFLRTLRESKKLSLRDVEEATEKEISNAYLRQLENDKIKQPSPSILLSLSDTYGCAYEVLMERAGYLVPSGGRKDSERHGRIATFAGEDLTKQEEDALLEYLAFIRSKRTGSK